MSQVALVALSFSGTPLMKIIGVMMTRPTIIIPAMAESGPIMGTRLDDARVPAEKKNAVRRPNMMLMWGQPTVSPNVRWSAG